MVLSYIFGVVLFQSLLLDVSSRTRTGAKCILLTVTIVVFFVLTLSVSGDRTRVELQKLLRPLGHLQGRSFRRSQATPARSELPQVTGNTCKVRASASHRQQIICTVVLFTVEERGEEKRCFSCTRTGADSFLLVWWKGGVERNGVSLPHAPEPIVLSMVVGRGGEK
jgi:hypothetical protein